MSYIQDTGHELVNCFIISIYFQSNLAIVFTFLKYQHSSWPDVARVLSTASKRGGEHVRGVKRSSSVACTFRESPPPRYRRFSWWQKRKMRNSKVTSRRRRRQTLEGTPPLVSCAGRIGEVGGTFWSVFGKSTFRRPSRRRMMDNDDPQQKTITARTRAAILYLSRRYSV